MSSSTPHHKFLLDENVRRELYVLLDDEGFDVKLAPKSATDSALAKISKTEHRALVTNDADFATYTKGKVFSVVWLRIRQSNHLALLASFEELLREIVTFEGKLIVLKEKEWEEYPLITEIKL